MTARPATVALFAALPEGSAPERVRVLPAGAFTGRDGRGPYRLEDPHAVIAATLADGPIPVDENHSTDLARGRSAPARGWITALEAAADGLYATVEWTAEGRALVEGRAYRGLSPVIVAEQASGRVVRVLRVALTNDPNLGLHLFSRQETSMDLIARLRTALGLAADASEDAVVAAATAAKTTATTAASTHAADLAALAKAAGHTGEATVAALATHLQTRQAEGDPAQLRETVVALQTQLDQLTAQTRRAEAERVVDAAIAAGKPIRALRDHYVTRHAADPAGVAKELAALPSIHDGGIRRPPAGEGAQALSDDQRRVAALMGLDEAKFAEALKAADQEIAR